MPTVDLSIRLFRSETLAEGAFAVSDATVRLAEDLLSEHDVLRMPAHDLHYQSGAMTALMPPAPGISVPDSFEKMRHKASSKDVIGNIGEGLGIAAFLEAANLSLDDAVRVRRSGNKYLADQGRRMPDFVVELPPTLLPNAPLEALVASINGDVASVQAVAPFASRFPVEAKANGTRAEPYWSALWQLIEYWHSVVKVSPAHIACVGYGVVIHAQAILTAKREVRVHLIAPADQQGLIAKLSALPPDRTSTMRDFNAWSGNSPLFVGQDSAS